MMDPKSARPPCPPAELELAIEPGSEMVLGLRLESVLRQELELALGPELELALGPELELALGPELELALVMGIGSVLSLGPRRTLRHDVDFGRGC